MIADVVLGIWLIMAAIYGWKRKAIMEFNSLLIFLISYGLARLFAALFSPGSLKLAGTNFGPVGSEMLLAFILWLVLLGVLNFLWKKLKPAGAESGVRIELDEHGEPIVKGAFIKSLFGSIFGMLRGAGLYMAVLLWLTVLTPIISYKDGKGMTVVHPKSYTVKIMRQNEPLLQRIEWTTRGLRSLDYARRTAHGRRALRRNPKLKKLSSMLHKLPDKNGMIRRAKSRKQGKRDSTLLLWMQSFQKTVASDKYSSSLKTLAKLLPAPFDGGKISKSTKKKKRKRRRRRK